MNRMVPPRHFVILATAASFSVLSLSACSRQAADTTAPEMTEAAADATPAEVGDAAVSADAASAAGPAGAGSIVGASPEVASGIVFAYRFAFRLDDAKVADAQDRHVAACAALGRSRCRMTGIAYRSDKDRVIEAHTDFLLDPAIARSFGRDAADVVEGLGGRLDASEVGGDDVGTGIVESQRRSAAMGGDRERLAQRLREPGLSASERRDLQEQMSQIDRQLTSEEQSRRGGEARLATTPVRFTYNGLTGVGGLDPERPFGSALEASASSFATASAFLLMVAGLILPWALIVGGITLAVRFLVRRKAPATPPA